MKNKQLIGFVAGIVLAVVIMLLPLETLPPAGQRCLALSLLAVVWWAFGVIHPGYTSLLMLTGYVLLGVAPASEVFSLWGTPLVYMVVGGYLIASAVRGTGLGKRIAFIYALRYITGYRSVIIGAYLLGFLLSFLIPHPWPRSFMIVSVLAMVTRSANMPKEDAANIGLAVFASSTATSTILLTGDSALNIAAVGMGGVELGWLGWIKWMGVPGIVSSILMMILQFMIYKPKANFTLNKDLLRKELAEMGPLSGQEIRCLIWIILAVIAWVTDSVHGVNPGWVALLCAIGMTLPRIGGVLNAGSWNDVSLATLFFLTAALGIGKIGGLSGMNAWLASVLLPSQAPTNAFLFAGFVTVIAVVIHMCLGSALAVLGIVVPTIVAFGNTAGISPMASTLLVYTAVAIHFVLPFHHMNILVGLGEKQGGYNDKEVIRLGLPLTIVVFIVTMLIEVPWWKLIGVM